VILCPFDWGSLPEARIKAKQKRKKQYTGALGKIKLEKGDAGLQPLKASGRQ
jgi:hypothetical protein